MKSYTNKDIKKKYSNSDLHRNKFSIENFSGTVEQIGVQVRTLEDTVYADSVDDGNIRFILFKAV